MPTSWRRKQKRYIQRRIDLLKWELNNQRRCWDYMWRTHQISDVTYTCRDFDSVVNQLMEELGILHEQLECLKRH